MTTLFLALPGNETMAERLAATSGGEAGVMAFRRFPDGEAYVRLPSGVSGRDVVFVCTLAHPDEQFLPLLFAARAARDQGASRLTLVTPYLGYMRQDTAFQPGEAVTSRTFASLLAREFDRLITVDPHLHRYRRLEEIYSLSCATLHAGPLLSAWVQANVADPLVVGPDAESEQWATAIAAGAPAVVLHKDRRGDRTVEISFPDLTRWAGRQPVLVDDVASSGRTLVQACKGLIALGFAKPVCAVVHGLFAEDAHERLSRVSERIVSTDTIPHTTNEISVVSLVAAALGPQDLGAER